MFQVTQEVFSGGRAASKDDAKQSEFQHGPKDQHELVFVDLMEF